MRLSQIISILATFTAITGAFFLLREDMQMVQKAFGLWIIFYYGWIFAEQHEYKQYEDKE
jgi:hypothetical protein